MYLTRRRVISLGIIVFCAIFFAVGWWLYQTSFNPFVLPPEMNIDIVHASPGIIDGCGVCHASALAAVDDTCLSCHTETENIPPQTFVGIETDPDIFNLPHHLLSGTTFDALETALAPGCVDDTLDHDGCHTGMETDARTSFQPIPDRDYCHDPVCHAGMTHNP